MQLVRTLSFILALALAGASTVHAQSKAPPEKAPAREELGKADADKVEKFLGELHGAAVKHQGACPKMATALGAVLDRHLAAVQKLAESGKDMPQAAKDRSKKKLEELSAALAKCQDDKGVQGAWLRLMSAVGKKKDAPPPAEPPAARSPAKK
ncbi:MAG TPA: hypothetical protein VK932_17550 [Kofleriaceae bacterium]|nr:hypothetical protein [Kofleriaceae bacterium]